MTRGILTRCVSVLYHSFMLHRQEKFFVVVSEALSMPWFFGLFRWLVGVLLTWNAFV